MKLVNHTLKYLSLAFLGIIGLWAFIFYINMLDEIDDSIDDGLNNYKLLILKKISGDPSTLNKNAFGESNYMIRKIPREHALTFKDVYKDTLMYMEYEEDLEPVRLLTTAFNHDENYYQLTIASSMVEEDDLIEDLIYAIIWLYIILIVTVLFVNNIVLRQTWKPFYSLLDKLKEYRIGKAVTTAKSDTPVTEFRQLYETLDTLLNYVNTSFHNQKQFIENAAHELQTPLAISINKLELLSEKGGYPAEGQHAIGQVIQTLERLTRLNKSLLLLSKIENKQFDALERIVVNDVIKKLAEEFSDLAEFKSVRLSVENSGKLVVEMNADLCTIMLSNLIKNAIIHNVSDGNVRIIVESDGLTIANTGVSEPLEAEQIFLRFHKGTHAGDSTGLGLAIVRTITGYYGFKITYRYTDLHTMRLEFPPIAIVS